MLYLFQISGEHPTLPEAELKSVLDAEGLSYNIICSCGRLLVYDLSNTPDDFLDRMAYTLKAASHTVVALNPAQAAYEIMAYINRDQSLVVRSESHSLEKEFGAFFHKTGYKIDVHNPEVTVLAYRTCGKIIAGIEYPLKRSFSKRRPQYRLFFHPTSMNPKLARALVNLSHVKKGLTLLDPFCGSGGILIEAGLIGVNVLGSDIEAKMVEGCRQNLSFYGIKGSIKQADALRLGDYYSKVDAVVTDPPYARSSYVSEYREDMAAFYEKFLKSASEVLDAGRRLVMVVPEQYKIKHEGYMLMEEHLLKVHRSLTRRILVLEKLRNM